MRISEMFIKIIAFPVAAIITGIQWLVNKLFHKTVSQAHVSNPQPINPSSVTPLKNPNSTVPNYTAPNPTVEKTEQQAQRAGFPKGEHKKVVFNIPMRHDDRRPASPRPEGTEAPAQPQKVATPPVSPRIQNIPISFTKPEPAKVEEPKQDEQDITSSNPIQPESKVKKQEPEELMGPPAPPRKAEEEKPAPAESVNEGKIESPKPKRKSAEKKGNLAFADELNSKIAKRPTQKSPVVPKKAATEKAASKKKEDTYVNTLKTKTKTKAATAKRPPTRKSATERKSK